MNRVVLVFASLALLVFGGLLLSKDGNKAAPYYVHQTQTQAAPPKSIFLEPPTVSQIQHDLSGKTIVIDGKDHQFAGPELNYMNILSANPTQDGRGLAVEVQVCADATIVKRKGVFGVRRSYTHENVCGSLRVYYDKTGAGWTYRMAENIDLQKFIRQNAKAPPSDVQVFKYPSR